LFKNKISCGIAYFVEWASLPVPICRAGRDVYPTRQLLDIFILKNP
jgi:hypothetical protein